MKQLSIILLVLSLFQIQALFSQDKPAYVIYTANGKKTTFEKLVEASENKELVLFGEFHDNPISHWLKSMRKLEQIYNWDLKCLSRINKIY
jgi:uncharacterized iron-regulated protein